MSLFRKSGGNWALIKVKNELDRLVYIGHPMGGHLSGKIGQMCLGMIETGRVN
jgi:hypothetical protein